MRRKKKRRNPVEIEVTRENPPILSESRRRVLKTKLRELERERDQLERRINRILRLIDPRRLVLRKAAS